MWRGKEEDKKEDEEAGEAGKERRVERSFAILSPKKLRKEVARREGKER